MNLTGSIPGTFFASLVDLQTLILDDNPVSDMIRISLHASFNLGMLGNIKALRAASAWQHCQSLHVCRGQVRWKVTCACAYDIPQACAES